MNCRGVNEDIRRGLPFLEATGVIDIYNSTSRKDHFFIFKHESYILFFPVQKIIAFGYCMTPAHIAPDIAVRIVLIKHVVSALNIPKEAVWIIYPVLNR